MICVSLYSRTLLFFFFFFNDTATTEIYTVSLHDALPIFRLRVAFEADVGALGLERSTVAARRDLEPLTDRGAPGLHGEALLRDEAKVAAAARVDLDRRRALLNAAAGPRGPLVQNLSPGLR